ncbi:MAG: hypothetical protein K8953_06810, partial [Proteobacteria bacterium]|nr:hypothetical protein [Pseudomonadota bacterium]
DFANANTGTLTGLIGQSGAVGIFASNSGTAYVGGFVAAEAAEVEPEGDGYTAFKNYYSAETGNRELLATAPTSGGAWRGFLQGTATGLVEDGIDFGLVDTAQPDVTHFKSAAIKLGGNAGNEASPDGFAVLSGRVNGAGARFAVGLLSGTDLGAPLPTEAAATVTWTGSLHYATSSNPTGLHTATGDFTLIVDVNEGTLTSETRVGVPVGQAVGTVRTIAINGRFGTYLNHLRQPTTLPSGILGGTISLYTDGVKGSDEPLIGLIGDKGVLGVFRTSSLVGGFQAASLGNVPTGVNPNKPTDPTDPTDVVEVDGTTAYQAWVASFDGSGANAARGDTLQASNYTPSTTEATADFIRLHDNDDADEIANNIVATNFTSANFAISNDLFLTGSTTSGAVFGHVFDTHNRLYAGLLPTTDVGVGTDLGAPIAVGFTTATWKGKLAGYDLEGLDISNDDFRMEVTFAGTSGTIKSLNADGIVGATTIGETNAFLRIDFNGVFDDKGVISGTTTGSFNAAGANGTFNGLIGVNGAVGVFKGTGGTGELKSYVGGFVVAKSATPPSTTCNPDMPFTDANCDAVTDAAARLAEANRCYNDGGAVQTLGDCVTISACLARNASGLFSATVEVGAQDNRVACSSPAFAGARANYCGGNNIVAGLCKDFIALNNAETACLNNPF